MFLVLCTCVSACGRKTSRCCKLAADAWRGYWMGGLFKRLRCFFRDIHHTRIGKIYRHNPTFKKKELDSNAGRWRQERSWSAGTRETHECDCTAWLFEQHVFRSTNERGQWRRLAKFQGDISLNMLQRRLVLFPNFFVSAAPLSSPVQDSSQGRCECPGTSVWIKEERQKRDRRVTEGWQCSVQQRHSTYDDVKGVRSVSEGCQKRSLTATPKIANPTQNRKRGSERKREQGK